MNFKSKETINKISAVIIIIAGLINVLAGTISTIINYSQKYDKYDLDSFLIDLSFDNLDFAILFAIVFLIAICSTVLLILFNDVEKWQSNPVSRVANCIFFIALAVYTFTIKNKQIFKKGVQV